MTNDVLDRPNNRTVFVTDDRAEARTVFLVETPTLVAPPPNRPPNPSRRSPSVRRRRDTRPWIVRHAVAVMIGGLLVGSAIGQLSNWIDSRSATPSGGPRPAVTVPASAGTGRSDARSAVGNATTGPDRRAVPTTVPQRSSAPDGGPTSVTVGSVPGSQDADTEVAQPTTTTTVTPTTTPTTGSSVPVTTTGPPPPSTTTPTTEPPSAYPTTPSTAPPVPG